jgi:Fe-S cluster assembly protein SufD
MSAPCEPGVEASLIDTEPMRGDWPAWFHEDRLKAWELFGSLPWPSRTDEPWRFANLKAAKPEGFVPAGPVRDAGALVARSSGWETVSGKLVFGNDTILHSETSALPAGVLLLPIEEAVAAHPELIRSHFMTSEPRLGSRKFAALHRAKLRTGAFLYVPRGVIVEQPIEIWHWVEGEKSTVFPHTLVVLGERASAIVIDRFASSGPEASLAVAVNDLTVGKGASLTYTAVQDWSDATTAFHVNTTDVAKDGTSTALQMNLGGRYVRGESDSHLRGEGSRSVMLSVNPADKGREIDQRTFQDHFSPRATSDLLYHNALSDNSRTIFSGLIKVEEGAHETDAYQKVRNLMLGDEAEANSMPGLEILADNVRCTHGATSGELNEDELFYMQARGIPPKQAARLIVRGFLGSVLERLENAPLQEHLGGILDLKLGL